MDEQKLSISSVSELPSVPGIVIVASICPNGISLAISSVKTLLTVLFVPIAGEGSGKSSSTA
jgi:hypothetical protein